MNKYGQEIECLDQWADLANRNGDYEEADFLTECAREWAIEVRDAKYSYQDMERRADELAYGMVQIKNLLEDLRTDIQQASRLNRKDILDRLREVLNDFSEYI